MSGMKRNLVLALAVAAAVAAPSAFATNGYFSHGYGMKALGSGGAATAMTVDAFGGANNPASMVWVGNRFDLGINLFSPNRKSERSGSAAGTNLDGTEDSDSNEFFIPEFGYNTMLNPNMSFGVTVYGNGGMNTNYPGGSITSASGKGTCNFFQTGGLGTIQPSYNLLCGNGRLGVDLAQLVIAPTLSYKLNSTNSVGISPLLGYQRFKAEGLQAFAGFSRDPGNLTNNGYSTSTGFGVRVGWMGKLSDSVTMG
ncbi:OmpP1/FadL family transporter, partial [Sulfuricaulis sp.]|uniref:OmpP1/FadL family transporter n=1 Tax=Sulfuricaulis sp. TaxID=2003553 RepID=UPI00355A668A